MSTLLQTLYGYHGRANMELLDRLETVDRRKYDAELETAVRLISHYYVVSRIFAGHLQGLPHGFTTDNLDDTLALTELRASVAASDEWYLGYVRDTSPSILSEAVSFTFTDGDKGQMTREEMLLHVALHATLHRGEVSRILWQLSITPPWETLAVHLHQAQPARRLQGNRE